MTYFYFSSPPCLKKLIDLLQMTKNKLAQDNEKQLLIFQLRCLDLIEILANRKHGIDEGSSEVDSLILVTVRPLLVSIQHASKNASDMTFAEKASVLLRYVFYLSCLVT